MIVGIYPRALSTVGQERAISLWSLACGGLMIKLITMPEQVQLERKDLNKFQEAEDQLVNELAFALAAIARELYAQERATAERSKTKIQ